jgi:hypothetical protein
VSASTKPPAAAVRLSAATMARVDALIPGLSSAWHKANRSDALRFVILAGLDAVEAQAKGKPRKERAS